MENRVLGSGKILIRPPRNEWPALNLRAMHRQAVMVSPKARAGTRNESWPAVTPLAHGTCAGGHRDGCGNALSRKPKQTAVFQNKHPLL